MHSKIKYKLPFFCLLIISILLINACNKDEKKNPCAGYIRPQAGFTIQDDARITYGKETGIVLSTDTVYSQSDIMFTSLLDYDTYQWRVVGDPDFVKTTKSFKLIFKANFSIDMQLIGKRKPNTTCDPDDDGIDTIVRSIVVLNSDSSLGQILGKYYGYDVANPQYKCGIEFTYEIIPKYSSGYYLYLKYFPDSCDMPMHGYFMHGGYNMFSIENHNATAEGGLVGCQSPRGWFFYSDKDIDIQYSTKDIENNGPEIKRRFIGKKLK